jgi:tetratricopeptide (TPR) repeat protein
VSIVSATIRHHPLQKTIYISLILYWILLILSKSSVKNLDFSLYFHYTLIAVNLYVIFRIGILFANNNSFIAYIENHFANTGIFAIFLTLSSIAIANLVRFPKRKINLLFLSIVPINLILITYLQSRISIFIISVYIIALFLEKINFKSSTWKNITFLFISCSIFLFLFFCMKTDSSGGRRLIIKISINVLKDNFLTGTGGLNTFALHYPKYQADYFAKKIRPEHEVMLADNTKFAFSEPLQMIIETGVLGFFLILLLSVKVYLVIRTDKYPIKHVFFSLLFASCFSYVFHITIFQVIFFIIICYIASKDKAIFQLNVPASIGGSVIILLLVIKALNFSLLQFTHSLTIEQKILRNHGLTDKHNVLLTYFKDNPIFLTSYAYELFYRGRYDECEDILNAINQIHTHSNTENLKGKLFEKLGNYKKAEFYYIRTCNICPNRFRHKHDLFKFYLKNNQMESAKNIALQIHNLKEKIPSSATMAIKLEAERFLSENNIYGN